MSLRRFALAAAALVPLALMGCESAPPPTQRLPEMTFRHLKPYRLDIGQVEIVNEYQPVQGSIETLMPVSPSQAAQRWAQDRLQPIGRSGYARLIIKDASVVESRLKTDQSIKGAFKTEQAARYDATLSVELVFVDGSGASSAVMQANAKRSRTVPEGIKLNERDKIWYELVENLTNDMNAQLEPLIGQYGARWIM